MIGYLTGKVINSREGEVIVQTKDGVGYLVTLVTVGHMNEGDIELYIYTSVREDDISLWGFNSLVELDLFKLLLQVSGVGSRTAKSLMETIGIGQIIKAIRNEEYKDLKAPGIGKKTAERIIIDMRSKVDRFNLPDSEKELDSLDGDLIEIREDAVSAVESLGYKRQDINDVVTELDLNEYQNTQDLVKEILKHI